MRAALFLSLLLVGCSEKKATPPDAGRARTVTPMEPLTQVAPESVDAGDTYFFIVPLPPVGPAVPPAEVVPLNGDAPAWKGGAKTVLLKPDADTYLAQVAVLLTSLDDAGATVWLAHPDAPVAYPVTLRDEASFQRWLDEPVPGKLRVVHRQDGFELQTNMGKMPGPDINGPTVPVRGGKWDLTTLQKGFARIKTRFTEAPDVCFMPSFGMSMADATRAIAANWVTAETAHFSRACLVYPRPVTQGSDAGAGR